LAIDTGWPPPELLVTPDSLYIQAAGGLQPDDFSPEKRTRRVAEHSTSHQPRCSMPYYDGCGMPCFLDTGPFGKLLTAVDHKTLPPVVLSESLLSPVTALELAQHTPKLRILVEHSAYLRPLTRRHSQVVLDFNWGQDFVAALSSKDPNYFRGLLNVMHTVCVVNQPFMDFHLSRYGKNPPKTIASSQRYTSDVRDSMQLILSPEVPFITSDRDLVKKAPPPMMRCQVFQTDLDPNCIVFAMRLVNSGMITADKCQ
jgi:hypothetical protein